MPLAFSTLTTIEQKEEGVLMKRFAVSIFVCLLAFVLQASAQTTSRQPTAPDNTKTNKRDRDQGRPTADQQKANRPDTEITREIRRAITNDKGLSTYAKNVKVITQNGNVTLRGPVRSAEDKSAIEAKATEVAGSGHVKSELQIASKQTGKATH
jgi:hyperosmotically inducible protein